MFLYYMRMGRVLLQGRVYNSNLQLYAINYKATKKNKKTKFYS